MENIKKSTKKILKDMIFFIQEDEEEYRYYDDWKYEIDTLEYYFNDYSNAFTKEHQDLYFEFEKELYISKGVLSDALPQMKALHDAL